MFSVLHAGFLVVPLFAQSLDWTTRNALSTDIFRKMQTVGMVIIIGPCAWRNLHGSNNGTNANCLADRGDQAVTEAEGPQPSSIGSMAFRPV